MVSWISIKGHKFIADNPFNRYYHKGVGFMISSNEAHAAFR